MPFRYLLDTNTVSYSIKGNPRQVRAKLSTVIRSTVALSAFTQAELLYGLALNPGASRLRAIIEQYLRDFPVLPWDSAAACAYGDLRAAQRRKGRPLSHEDLMIAAHAISLDLTLVTSDRAFSLIDGLRTEDWTTG
jgi:tRNA(fMet)-specific endonuclease VapC